jgi:hypothetical protein
MNEVAKARNRAASEQTSVTKRLSQKTDMAFVRITYDNSYVTLQKNKTLIHYKDEVFNSVT